MAVSANSVSRSASDSEMAEKLFLHIMYSTSTRALNNISISGMLPSAILRTEYTGSFRKTVNQLNLHVNCKYCNGFRVNTLDLAIFTPKSLIFTPNLHQVQNLHQIHTKNSEFPPSFHQRVFFTPIWCETTKTVITSLNGKEHLRRFRPIRLFW
jgi:hypothetical protein